MICRLPNGANFKNSLATKVDILLFTFIDLNYLMEGPHQAACLSPAPLF